MSAATLIVEERLRVALVYLDALKHIALLVVDEPGLVPQFETPAAFAKWVARLAESTSTQVRAVRGVLPPACADLEAPFQGRVQ